MLRSDKSSIELHTDEHQQYKAVLNIPIKNTEIVHKTTSSKAIRSVHNPLFPVNYIDREIRKDCSDHCRETLQWAKNVANAMDRLAVYRFHHNFMKEFRINGSEWQGITHAIKAGFDEKLIKRELKTLFTKRRFFHRSWNLNEGDRKVWGRCISTPHKRLGDYRPGYAAA